MLAEQMRINFSLWAPTLHYYKVSEEMMTGCQTSACTFNELPPLPPPTTQRLRPARRRSVCSSLNSAGPAKKAKLQAGVHTLDSIVQEVEGVGGGGSPELLNNHLHFPGGGGVKRSRSLIKEKQPFERCHRLSADEPMRSLLLHLSRDPTVT